MSAMPQAPSSGGLRYPPAMEAPKESAITRLLIAPLTFISFLLSLALLDSRNYSPRNHTHSPSPAQPTSFLGHVKAFLHNLMFKTVGSLYVQDKEGKEPWHWNTYQRKMMKAEIDDAFRLRKSVMVGLVVGGILGIMGLWGVVGWGWGFLRG